MNRAKLALGCIVATIGAAGLKAAAAEDWSWAFPPGIPAMPDKPDTVKQYGVPGSARHFTEADVHDLTRAVDWFPDEHPAMPAPVAEGHGGSRACAFCHMPSGTGRPENSALAGLPADYIERQIAAFADGTRQAAIPNYTAGRQMTVTAKATSAADIALAAAYFSKLPFVSPVTVVETAALAQPHPYRFVYVLGPGPKEPIGDRIIEVPSDTERFELRDPHVRFTAYVPIGAIAEGKHLVESGGTAAQPCEACHGVKLQGDVAPPLAGRSPAMIVRQMMAFKAGTRSNAEAAPMRAVAADLSMHDMIALAAYAGSLKP